jgi:5-methylcytosine-specific restriction endonuclease McrA
MPYKDPDRRRAYGRDWMRRNPEKAREAMRRWRQRHPDKHSAEGRAFYARHRARVDTRSRLYRQANPQVARAKWQNYRASRKAAPGSFSGATWLSLVRSYRGRCAYCGKASALVVEHRVPLSRSGTNEIANIVPACRSCNSRKHAMSEDQFVARLRHEGRRVRPSLRRAACSQHVEHERDDQEEGKQA